MASDPSDDPLAQCSVPNIIFSTESATQTSQNGGFVTPNAPVILLAAPHELQKASAPSGPSGIKPSSGDMASISMLQRPLSAPTSMSSSPSGPFAVQPASPDPSEAAGMDVDASIIEALKSKDRLYVLKLGESMEKLITQGKLFAKVDLQPGSSYQRLLVHRCAAYYHLTPESNQASVSVVFTADSRIPSRRISELVPPEELVLPAFQIMRRVDRSKATSRATSVDGNLTDDGDDSTRSQGSGSKKKQHMTMEEREAAYKEARSRIFMDFEEKDATTSSNGAISSAASIVSFAGGSTGMSSIDGDGASTAPTESEYSGPAGRAKDLWYNGGFNDSNGRVNVVSTLRSTAPPFTSPNVVPPPPNGTVHFIQPSADHGGHQSDPSGHNQQSQRGAAPAPAPASAPSYVPYTPPAIYPYYVPYVYPIPYPHPVSFQPPVVTSTSQESNGQDNSVTQVAQHQHTMQVAPGFVPHAIAAQPYPGYMWMAAPAPGYIPVPSHGPPAAAQATAPSAMLQQQPPPAVNISRPASQASHVSYDPRTPGQTQSSLAHQQVTPQQQNQQTLNYPSYPPPNNSFSGSHHQGGPGAMSPNRGSVQMHPAHSSGQHSPVSNRSHPPVQNTNFNPSQAGSQQSQLNAWGSQHVQPNMGTGPPRAQSRGAMAPPPAPGRMQVQGDGSRATNNSGPGPAPGIKRGPRASWGSHSYGPGVSVGGIHSQSSAAVAGAILRAPEGLNIRVLPPITLDGQSTGSSNGSSSSLRKKQMGGPGGGGKSLADDTSSVTSSSSSSSKRTYTSTASSQPPQHHPLPEKPSWLISARPHPGGGLHRSKGSSSSNNSSAHSLAPMPATGIAGSSGTPSPVSNPGYLSSTSSLLSGAGDPVSREFPPLTADGRGGNPSLAPHRGSSGGAWGMPISRNTIAASSSGQGTPLEDRLEGAGKNFERPQPKPGTALFNPRATAPGRSKSKESAAPAADDLALSLGGISLNNSEPDESVPKTVAFPDGSDQ